MIKDINGLGGNPISQPKNEHNARQAAADTQPAPSQGQSQRSGDVQLSNEARTLQSLADTINNLPEVNIERAEKIKAALANGEYKVNDLILADKILSSEALLGS